MITEIEIGRGRIAPGTPVTIGLWSDPDGDLDPTDAQLILGHPVISTLEGSGQFVLVNIPDTFVGAAGTSFFLGATGHFDQTLPLPTQFPAAFDATSPDLNAWYVSADAPIDLNNISAAAAEFGRLNTVCSCDGDWTIRAITCTTGHCLESVDLNGNLVPDDCDGNGLADLCQAITLTGLAAEYYASDNLGAAMEYQLRLEWQDTNGGQLQLQWQPPGGSLLPVMPAETRPIYDRNLDGIPDVCQLVSDCNGNLVPDECQRCDDKDGNGWLDSCEPGAGPGLVGQYFMLHPLTLEFGSRTQTVVDPQVAFNWGLLSPVAVVPQTGAPNLQALDNNFTGDARVPDVGGLLSVPDNSFTLEGWVKLLFTSSTSSVNQRKWLFLKKPPSSSDGDGTSVQAVVSSLRLDDTNWHFGSFGEPRFTRAFLPSESLLDQTP